MGPDPKILDDLARVAGGAVNIVSGLQKQVREDMRSRLEEMAANMNLVPREDFDHACAVMTEMMGRIEELTARLDALEGKKSTKTTGKGKTKSKSKAATGKKKGK